jgi:hypothetical protein
MTQDQIIQRDGSEGIIFPVAPDPTCWPRVHEAWDSQWQRIAVNL